MKRLWRAIAGRLQVRLLLIGSLPLLLATVLFTSYAIFSRQNDLLQRTESFGVRTAEYLANTLDFALFAKDPAVLASTATDIQSVPGILGVAFLDQDRRVLHASPGFPRRAQDFDARDDLGEQAREVGGALLVERVVYARDWGVNDYVTTWEMPRRGNLLGWVVVALDLEEARRAQDTIVVTSVGIGAVVLGSALLMSLVLAGSVVAPVRRLTDVVARLRGGDLGARAQATTSDELAELAEGINHLGETVAQNQRELERQVAQATRDLRATLAELRDKNLDLELSTEKAEAANLAKSDFLARMSHELRTPLTSIQGFVRLLESSLPDAAERNYCRIIDTASLSLMALIDDILEFARLQSGVQRVELAPFDLFDALENTVRLLAPIAHGKGVEVYLEIDRELSDCPVSDVSAVRQIVNNLVGNAVKFTTVGHVQVRCTRLADGWLQILVRDTGVGIAAEQREQIFDAFQQGDSGIARRFGGSGLGLAITHQHVDMLGGRIALDSQLGIGSEFRVELPCRWQSAVPPPAAPQPGTAVVFDSTQIGRDAACALLQRLFREVVCVGSFDDLIDVLASRPIAALNVNWSLSEPVSAQLAVLRHVIDELRCPIAIQVPLAALHEDIPAELVRGQDHVRWLGKPGGLEELRNALWPRLSDRGVAQAADLSGVRVLVVEDNPLSRLLLNKLLARTGCDYLEAADGRAAIEICQARRFDLLLFDLHMPEITGVEALRQLQQPGGCNADTPVIVLTADQALDIGRELSLVRVARVLGKPFDEQLLLETMLTLSGRSGMLPAAWFGSRAELSREAYFDEIDRLLSVVDSALSNGNQDGARESCHQLAGIVAIFRLGELEQLTQLLHSLVRVSDVGRAASMVVQLRIENDAQRRQNRRQSA